MTFTVEFSLFILFSILCSCLSAISSENLQKSTNEMEEIDFQEDLFDRSIEEMIRDATEGTTPAVCSAGMGCGFQQYEGDENSGYFLYPAIHYCNCEEGYACTYFSKSMKRRFFHYSCQIEAEVSSTNSEVIENAGDESGRRRRLVLQGFTTPLNKQSTQTDKYEVESSSFRSRLGDFSVADEL